MKEPEYKAKPGDADHHGEMTGAISFNMVLSMPPVMIWVFLIAPFVFDTLMPKLVVAGVIALVTPFIFFKPSQYLWARFSDWADRH